MGWWFDNMIVFCNSRRDVVFICLVVDFIIGRGFVCSIDCRGLVVGLVVGWKLDCGIDCRGLVFCFIIGREIDCGIICSCW